MRYVAFDLAAARRASAECRGGADSLRALADRLGAGVHSLRWEGGHADGAREDVSRLVADLRAEAAAMDRTADRVDEAAAEALRLERDRAEAARAAAERARREAAQACTPTTTQPTWAPR